MNNEPNKANTKGDAVFSASLTPPLHRFMLALQKRLKEYPDVSPSFEELRQDLGMTSKSGIYRLVIACEKRGRIKRLPNMSRSLTVINPVAEDYNDFLHSEDDDIYNSGTKPSISSFTNKQIYDEAVKRGICAKPSTAFFTNKQIYDEAVKRGIRSH